MAGLVLTNNARSTLAAAVAAGDASITLAAGDGAKFPVIGANQWHPLTALHADGSFEIMKVTARNADVLTVSRGQEGTAAQAFNAGDMVELRLTTAAMNDLINGVATLQTNKLDATATAADSSKLGGQLPSYYAIAASVPTKVSQLTNDSAYITAGGAPVQSVAGKTGVVTLAYADIGGLGSAAQHAATDFLGASTQAVGVAGEGNVAAETGGTAGPGGLTLRGVYNNGYPVTYGNVITLDANGGQAQLLLGWSGNSTAGNGVSENNFIRSLRDGHQAWSPWAKIYTDANLTNVSQLTNDAGYIAAGGAPVQSVAGKTGAVTLAKADVGLGSVDNTADSTKSVANAVTWNGGHKTVSTADPSGGADGDVWFKYS